MFFLLYVLTDHRLTPLSQRELEALRLTPSTVGGLLNEYCSVWFIDRDDDTSFDSLAESLGIVSNSSGRLHCAQDCRGKWRFLEDCNGALMAERPRTLRLSAVVSLRHLAELGCYVHRLHRVLPPCSTLTFADCSSWDNAEAALAASASLLRQLFEDGWKVDNGAMCSDPSALLLVKQLPPLRTIADEAAAAQSAPLQQARVLVPVPAVRRKLRKAKQPNSHLDA